MHHLIHILRDSLVKFRTDDLKVHAAALSYFAVFSLPPIFIVIMYSASRIYDQSAVEGWIYKEIGSLIGQNAPAQIAQTIKELLTFSPQWWTATLAVLFILYMATMAITNMKNTLNHIFDVKEKYGKARLLQQMMDRILSLIFVSVLGIILLLYISLSSFLQALHHDYLDSYQLSHFVNSGITKFLSFIALALFFSFIYGFLPDVKLNIKDTIISGTLAALFFSVGKSVIRLIIDHSKASSFYDAAGGLMVLMIWIYYASVVFYFGACITFVIFNQKMKHS